MRRMEVDEAVCVVLGVACDYGRGGYGDDYLEQMVKVVRFQARPTDQALRGGG